MIRLLVVGVGGLVWLGAAGASASNVLSPRPDAAGPVFRSLGDPALPLGEGFPGPVSPAAGGGAFPVALGASGPTGADSSGPPAPPIGLVLTRGTSGIQPAGGPHVSIDGLIVRRPRGESPASAVPEPGTIAAACLGIAAALYARRKRAR